MIRNDLFDVKVAMMYYWLCGLEGWRIPDYCNSPRVAGERLSQLKVVVVMPEI